MSLDRKHILSILGWGDGVKIPAANSENRELQNQLEELIKRKADTMVKLCMTKEKVEFTKKSLVDMNGRRDSNQEYLNRLRKQLDSNMNSMKQSELKQNLQVNDVKELKKRIQEIEEKLGAYQITIGDYTRQLKALKDSLSWGEDALFDWEHTVAQGERELKILEKYKQLNEDKYEALEREKKQVEKELIEAEDLEKREEERFKMLSLQLENVNKLTKEVSKDHERLMSVLRESVDTANQREEDNKRLQSVLCEVNNEARQKCSELYEEKHFYEDVRNTNESVRDEVKKSGDHCLKVKDEMAKIEDTTRDVQRESDLKRRSTGDTSGKIDFERKKNQDLKEKLDGKRKQLSHVQDAVKYISSEINALNVDNYSSEKTYRKSRELFEMKNKQLEEESKELDRLNLISQDLKQEISKYLNKIEHKYQECELAKKILKKLQEECFKKAEELYLVEQTILFLTEEERTIVKKIFELREKCSGKEEKEELEKEIKQLEEQHTVLLKDNLVLKKRLQCLQREYKEKLRNLKSAEDEYEKLSAKYVSTEIEYQQTRKDIKLIKEEVHKANAQLKLLTMREHCLRESISRDDTAIGELERRQDLLLEAMRERIFEVEAQKSVLLGKKKTLIEEKTMRGKQIDHINSEIKLNQSRYSTTLDLMGKDESGQQLSVAYFKIKLAQEKYELQIEQEELEAKIAKAENELKAMENTLNWVKATNENYKFGLERIDQNDTIKKEKDKAEAKFVELKNTYEEGSELLKAIRLELQNLLSEILHLKEQESMLLQHKNEKEEILYKLQVDLLKNNERLMRATNTLKKTLKAIKISKEPPKYKELAKKEIDIRIEEDRNTDVLQKLVAMSSDFDKIKLLLENFSADTGIPILERRSLNLQNKTPPRKKSSMMTRQTISSSSSVSSKVSIVNLDPAKLFENIHPPCSNRKYK